MSDVLNKKNQKEKKKGKQNKPRGVFQALILFFSSATAWFEREISLEEEMMA